MIEFLLHDQQITLTDIDPNTTVLEFLRDHRQLTGTKEGCASGDCGACTVVIAQLDNQQQLHYKTVNACITLISAIAGKQLISVEALKKEQLHSCQQAMIDQDGSQCGFCTPGFVMSLFSLTKNATGYNKHQVQQALAGNLCRCTGYRAIDSAAKQVLNNKTVDHFEPQQAMTQSQLIRMQADSAEEYSVLGTEQSFCHIPKNSNTLAQILLDYPQSKIIAGGTDLAISITQHGAHYSHLVTLQQVAELNTHSIIDDEIHIGAAVSLNTCQTILAEHFSDLSLLLDRFASLQVRNQGTLGGNIANASPIGDSPPALIALNTSLQLRRGQQVRRIKLADFFVDYRKTVLSPSEFIEKIIIPIPKHPFIYKIYKVSKRLDDDISAICAACFIQLDEQSHITKVRLAYGGMAAIAKRASHTEQALLSQPWQQDTVENAKKMLEQDFTPLSDFRASSEYRMQVAKNLLHKLLLESTNDALSKTEKTRIFDYV